jgi:hypothetical protein
LAVFVVLTVLGALSFYAELTERAWRRPPEVALAIALAGTAALYWPA